MRILMFILSAVSVGGFVVLYPSDRGVAIRTSFHGHDQNNNFHRQGRNDSCRLHHSNQGEDEKSINVLGTRMECCCSDVRGTGIGTGFYRNGFCSTGAQDIGRHTVCVEVTEEFLEFSKAVGNDLSTPMPEYMFPGLKGGDRWCLCAQRWAQAYEYGKAPKLYLKATHEKTLDYVDFAVLRKYAIDGEEADAEKGKLDEKREILEKLFEQEGEEESSSSSSSSA